MIDDKEIKLLVQWGNYLLSDERNKTILNKENKKIVNDSDLANFYQKNGQLKKYISKKQ
jgi:hypothetical protein